MAMNSDELEKPTAETCPSGVAAVGHFEKIVALGRCTNLRLSVLERDAIARISEGLLKDRVVTLVVRFMMDFKGNL